MIIYYKRQSLHTDNEITEGSPMRCRDRRPITSWDRRSGQGVQKSTRRIKRNGEGKQTVHTP